MVKVELNAEFLYTSLEERKGVKGVYEVRDFVVFAEGVGKLKFSSLGTLRLQETFPFDQFKEGQRVVVHCVVDTGRYNAPVLVLVDVDLD